MTALNFPSNPTTGQIYNQGSKSWTWDGSTWIAKNSAVNTWFDVTPPSDPSQYPFWWRTDEGSLKLYYNGTWVDSTGGAPTVQIGAMQQIATITITSSINEITFSSIPQNYTSLYILWSAQAATTGTGVSSLKLKLNGDSIAANYGNTTRFGIVGGGTYGSFGANTTQGVQIGRCPNIGNTGMFGIGYLDIPSYTSSTKKSIFAGTTDNSSASEHICLYGCLWNGTTAVNSITISLETISNLFSIGSVFTLYGIGGTGTYLSNQTGDPSLCQGRLTLESGVPISTTDQTAKTTIYFTPYKGNRISIYDNVSAWITVPFTETSIPLGTLTANKNYDVFAYNNGGTLALEFSAAWSGDNTRADALILQDGIYVKSSNKTRRYLGTFRTVTTTTTEDSGGGVTTNVGGKRFLWNYYNRVAKQLSVIDTTASWTYYNTSTWRVANGNAGNIVEFIVGIVEDIFDAVVVQAVTVASGAGNAQSGIGLDSTTSPGRFIVCSYSTYVAGQTVNRKDLPTSVGYHYLSWLERASNSGTVTWYGISVAPTFQSGLTATIQA